ncbi:MAG: tail fiber protein [Terracidiphilus sp.]
MTPFIGEILMFGGNFAPAGYAMCNGQLIPISQNQVLFSLLGTTYGGDGVNTFALPNLVSRLPVDVGTGVNLSNYALGQTGGAVDATITMSTMPAHTHTLSATQTPANSATIGNTVLPGQPTSGNPPAFYASQPPGQPTLAFFNMAAGAVSRTGGSQPHTNLMPSLCITFIIALQGVYPSRN